jgi:hypothetical protein
MRKAERKKRQRISILDFRLGISDLNAKRIGQSAKKAW